MKGKPIKKHPLFVSLLIVLLVLLIYVSFETTVRLMRLPDPGLIQDMERMIADVQERKSYLSASSPIYGWGDRSDVELLAESKPDNGTKGYTVLFIGDSVTKGFDMDATKAFPALLFEGLNRDTRVHVVNAAVQGFGVDQMMLKLEQVMPRYQANLVVFAYIPHDLWRAGRNINFGLTKPVLVDIGTDSWRMIPKRDLFQYYEDYLDAERRFQLCIWYLRHVFENYRYYFADFNTQYYEKLFVAIRNRLIALTDQYKTEVLVVRLASSWPGDAVPRLDRVAKRVFAMPAASDQYTFLDLENCTRTSAESAGINFTEAFKWHPGVTEHQIYANCLIGTLRRKIGLKQA